MKKNIVRYLAAIGFSASVFLAPAIAQAEPFEYWINHLDFLSGQPSELTVSFHSTNSGVGTGLSGLEIESTTTGEVFQDGGGNKAVETGVPVPPGWLVTGAKVCYESTAIGSFISQVRISQLQEPPETALVILDDGTDLTTDQPGAVCYTSAPTSIDPAVGALRMSLRVNFGDIADKLVVRGVALLLEPDLDSILFNHQHYYLTGKGRGHNKVEALTGNAINDEEGAEISITPVAPCRGKSCKKNK